MQSIVAIVPPKGANLLSEFFLAVNATQKGEEGVNGI